MSESPLRVIRERRAVIAREVADLDLRAGVLRAEDARLEIAEEVLVDLTGASPTLRDHKDAAKGRRRKKTRAGRAKSPPRPAHIPDTPTMIIGVLRMASSLGRQVLRAEEIRKQISEKYWPGVQIDAIGPTAWRMAQDGRLLRSADGYSLKNETPAAETAGASESSTAVNGAVGPPSPPDRGRSGEGVVLSG